MAKNRFTESNLIIPLCAEATDINAAVELDCFYMGKYNHATVIIQHSASVTGDNVLTVETGATDGADTADAYFDYRLGSGAPGAASADVLAAPATTRVATLTLTAATYQGKMLVLEIDGEDLSYPYVTVDLDGTASVGTIMAFAILSEPRYSEAVMDTAIPTS